MTGVARPREALAPMDRQQQKEALALAVETLEARRRSLAPVSRSEGIRKERAALARAIELIEQWASDADDADAAEEFTSAMRGDPESLPMYDTGANPRLCTRHHVAMRKNKKGWYCPTCFGPEWYRRI